MNEQEFVVAAVFEFEDEAHIGKSVLDAAGIEARVLGSETAGFGSLTNDAAFQLVVQRPQYEKAREALATAASDAESIDIPAWTCRCGEEVDEGFALCWSCGAEWPGMDQE